MTSDKAFAVYIMTNFKRGVLYVGVTSDLPSRATQHREGAFDGFTKKYQLKRLVWYRGYGDAIDAISFEKRLKCWRREWKFRLIEEANPDWEDLWPSSWATTSSVRCLTCKAGEVGPGQAAMRLSGMTATGMRGMTEAPHPCKLPRSAP
jgi:putative endonuclease